MSKSNTVDENNFNIVIAVGQLEKRYNSFRGEILTCFSTLILSKEWFADYDVSAVGIQEL